MFPSESGNVWKYVFEFGSGENQAIAESVLYRYENFYERTVICCSVQSGCPVGCLFCGTGKNFIRNLTSDEIVHQVDSVLESQGITDINHAGKRFQIMFMSMGEPFLNYNEVCEAIKTLHIKYRNAELLVSTVGIHGHLFDFLDLSQVIPKIGLQFSLHSGIDDVRNNLIPYKDKMSIREIRDYGIIWRNYVKRPVFLNYCVNNNNLQDEEINRIMDLFGPGIFNLTFSVICSPNETMKQAGCRNYERIKKIMQVFTDEGYNVRQFDPDGQDDIGGGCGQLWYVQKWLKEQR